MIKHSFEAPLPPEARAMLSRATGVNFMPIDTSEWLCVTGSEDGRLLGCCCFEPKTWFDWHFSVAIEDPRCMSRRVLKAMFSAVFTVGVRVTALVEPDNDRALRQMKRLGFQYEGYLRLGIEGTRDAMVWGMLREDCRYLPGYQGAGTIIPTDFAGEPNGQLA
jgi:hypothetical protein